MAAQTCKKGMYECIVYRNHSSCTCPSFKYNNICKHNLCISETKGIIQEHVHYILKLPRCAQPFKSGLLKPSKDAREKRWETQQCVETKSRFFWPQFPPFRRDSPQQPTIGRPFPCRHCQCRPCRIEFPRKQKIIPCDITVSHQ